MKKLLGILILSGSLMFLKTSNIFAQNNFQMGVGAIYGLEVEAIGVQAGAKYDITPAISGEADLAFFFPENYDWWEINVNGHYNFVSEESTSVYGLAGLNYATVKVDLGQFGSASNSEIGLNVGGGAEFGTGFGNFFTELKYALGNADQLGVSAGLRFSL